MDKERIDGFRSAFAPGETLFWQVPAAARERMAFYSENLPRLFLKKSRRYLRCPTTMRWNLCDFCRDRASASRRMCRSLALMIHWQAGKAQGGCHVRLYEDPLQNRHSGHLTGNAASLLFYRGSDHDWAAGRSRYCSRGTSAS